MYYSTQDWVHPRGTQGTQTPGWVINEGTKNVGSGTGTDFDRRGWTQFSHLIFIVVIVPLPCLLVVEISGFPTFPPSGSYRGKLKDRTEVFLDSLELVTVI